MVGFLTMELLLGGVLLAGILLYLAMIWEGQELMRLAIT
jgi:hypothetical protein